MNGVADGIVGHLKARLLDVSDLRPRAAASWLLATRKNCNSAPAASTEPPRSCRPSTLRRPLNRLSTRAPTQSVICLKNRSLVRMLSLLPHAKKGLPDVREPGCRGWDHLVMACPDWVLGRLEALEIGHMLVLVLKFHLPAKSGHLAQCIFTVTDTRQRHRCALDFGKTTCNESALYLLNNQWSSVLHTPSTLSHVNS